METNSILETGVEVAEMVEEAIDYKCVAETLTECLDKLLDSSRIAEMNFRSGAMVGVAVGAGSVVVGYFVTKKVAKFVNKKIEELKQEN